MNTVQHQAQHQHKIITISTELTQMAFRERQYLEIVLALQLS